jgi:hypothetical protein
MNYLLSTWKISERLMVVPMISATKLKTKMSRSLIMRKGPGLLFHSTHISMSAGKHRPSADKHRAPNNEMNSSKCGTATASKTATQYTR